MNIKNSKIKIFALGGLGENGKNMYVIEVNEKIFILDAGLKYPGDDLLGVDAVIPDFKYLVENKERIIGLFLSHGHEDHIGAVPNLLNMINIPIYGTRLTMALVEDSLRDNGDSIDKYQLIKIRPNNELTFDDVKEAELLAAYASERVLEVEALFKEGKEDDLSGHNQPHHGL